MILARERNVRGIRHKQADGRKAGLSATEQKALAALRDLPGGAMSRCADVLHDQHFRCHRGAMTVNGYKVVFGNDGFDPTGDEAIRSQREVVRLVRTINEVNKVWNLPILRITGFGVSSCGYTWAMRIETGYISWEEFLEMAVWDAWFRVCGGGIEGHPWPKRLKQAIRQMFYQPARN